MSHTSAGSPVAKRPELRSYQAPPSLTDDDEHTQILPSSLRSAAMLSHAQVSRPSRPLLDFSAHDDDDEATRMFESGQTGARDPALDYQTVPTTPAIRNTLSRNPAAVEDDIQARAQLARDTGENAITARRRHVQATHSGAELPRASSPVPADTALLPSRRPPRSATSTASAFQRTQAEPSSAFPPSMHSAPSPVPSTAASLPAASYGVSGEQIAALVSTSPRRRPASWFAVLGAAVAIVVLGSTVLLRNPSSALAASALADPTGAAAVASPPLLADVPLTAPPPSVSAVAVTPTPAPPPVAEEPAPVYVPGFAETSESPPESLPESPVAVPPAAPPARRAGAAPASPKTAEAPKPKPQKVAPPPKKVAAAKPAAEPPKKKAKADQSDEERKASEEAKRLAQKQLEDQL